uniref:Transposase n=1 Tax=Macrostomum lignano TaxID=282301 RepID=A0A1I8GIM2_9PLAT
MHRLDVQRQRQSQRRTAEAADEHDLRLHAQADRRRDRLLNWHTSHMSSAAWTVNVPTAARYAGMTSQPASAATLA